MSEAREEVGLSLHRYNAAAALLGAVGTVGVLAGMIGGQQGAWQAYLFGWIAWASLSLGCLGLILLKHCVNGKWGLPVLRLMEAGASSTNFIILFVLFLPILWTVLVGKDVLYPWANAELMATDHILHAKAWWLNSVGFTIRTIIYFVVWMFLAAYLR